MEPAGHIQLQPSRLSAFMMNPSNSRSREHILTTRAIYDLSLAAAASGYHLQTYSPVVDRDGFDLIIDDHDSIVPLQLKSRAGSQSRWSVHRKLLRPQRRDCELFGFEESPEGEGLGGGVLLAHIEPHDSALDVTYYYTDVHILTALWQRVVDRNRSEDVALRRLQIDLSADVAGFVALPKAAFVRANSPDAVLALAGLHSRYNMAWRLNIRRLAGSANRGEPLDLPEGRLRSTIAAELAAMQRP